MSLKVLHTSDWHLGKQLLKFDFHDDMEFFFEWLLAFIESEEIDVLLMSGDLFDQANPSQIALRQYYQFLKRLLKSNCKVIITGGNHDAPTVLNAPKELLEVLDISVVGGKPEALSDLFIPIEKKGEKLVVAAVPFLRDQDVRRSVSGESAIDKVEQLRMGLANYFEAIEKHYVAHYSGFSFIVMAHLYAQGAQISESERDIQIGNQAGVEAGIFGNAPQYVALGHIHKPQRVGSDYIRYCGSPIPLSFSERNDEKQVVVITIKNGVCTPKSVKIPSFRKLVTYTGTLEEVKSKLQLHQKTGILKDLVEILVVEEHHNTQTILELEQLNTEAQFEDLEIAKVRVQFKNQIQGTASFLQQGQNVADFKPLELFLKRLETEDITDSTELIHAFNTILEDV